MSNKFWVIADTPYNTSHSAALADYFANVPDDVSFIIHLGDIRSGSASSTDLSDYEDVADLLKQSPVPVFIIPGDNEYNDTDNPAFAWQTWQDNFLRFDQNWAHGITVSYQDVRPENFAFVIDGTLYIGINLVSGRIHDAAEWAERQADDLAWIQDNFALYGDLASSAVIFGHASPQKSGYSTFSAGLAQAAAAFADPIVYFMGDVHKWGYSQPYASAPNMTLISLPQTSASAPPLTVSTASSVPYPFSFDHAFSGAPIVGTDQGDLLAGTSKADKMYAGDGDDTLLGSKGSDLMHGGSGVNTASYAASGAVVVNLSTGTNSGSHAAGDALVNIAKVIGSAKADTLTGNHLDNVLEGGAGNDTLDGMGGADQLIGGLGNDTYVLGDVLDTIIESAAGGTDTVRASVTIDLALFGLDLENANLDGTADIDALGNATANVLTGNAGANLLDGGIDASATIADQMRGGLGNDRYIVRDARDAITESSNQGTDEVTSHISYTLGSNLEHLVLAGSDAISGTGNTLANAITGNGAANLLNGKAGNDVLFGGGGDDSFRFDTKLGATNIDTILDFATGVDVIQLENSIFTSLAVGNLADTAFLVTAGGSAAQDALDRIIYDASSGALYFDKDGTGSSAAVQFATLAPGTTLTFGDFIMT